LWYLNDLYNDNYENCEGDSEGAKSIWKEQGTVRNQDNGNSDLRTNIIDEKDC